ncbi:MAG: SIMPL domain-containing protein [bacterium]|nr:SIMPL domain-containing protein [bacterium]
MNSLKENKLLSVLLVIGIIWIAGQIRNDWKENRYIGRPTEVRDTITIAGEGKVTAIPDIATVEVGVVTEKSDVLAAQKENTSKVNELLKKVKDLKIEDKDIQTTNYQINPQYDYQSGRQTLRGYSITQSVKIKIRDLGKIGVLLSSVGEAGANQVSGVSFTIDEPEVLRQQAREKALDNAREKAKSLADHADVKLGKIVSFSESGGGMPPTPYYARAEALGMGGDMAMKSPDIQAGSLEVIVSVNVSYEIL